MHEQASKDKEKQQQEFLEMLPRNLLKDGLSRDDPCGCKVREAVVKFL